MSQCTTILVSQNIGCTKSYRATRVNEGIAGENVRNLMSNDDSGAGTGSTQNVKDKFMADTYKDEIVIPLGLIQKTRGSTLHTG